MIVKPRGDKRRLAAILAADMVGYSRLMEADESGTLARLRVDRAEIIDPAIDENSGRIFKTAGDGLLAEFASVIDAVQCAVDVQRRMALRNADVPEDQHIVFRVGINIGDIIVEDGDIFGDGVNIAARLEALAEPGGIYVARAVHEQVGDKLDVAFEDLGEKSVKNIKRPIRVSRVVLDQKLTAVPTEASNKSTAGNATEKPSIAVLPFANMSGDPEQEFFADGLTEDILTALSRFRDLFVISRTSAFAYKAKSVNVPQVAKDLGVQYVVEGSVRKAGNRVRVTVQLIDAATDRHIWAERYDRELEDIFAIQDEVTSMIVATLPGRLEAAAQDRVQRTLPDNMAAYECVLAGKTLHHRSNPEDNVEAQRMIERAVKLDDSYAHAHAWKACILGQAWTHGWCEDKSVMEDRIVAELKIALALDDNDSDVHRIFAAINLVYGNYDKAVYHQERAFNLNPNDDLIVVQQGEVLTWLGRPEEGIEWIKKAMLLNPFHPQRFWNHLGRAYFVARRYDETIDAFRHITPPDHTHHAFLAAAHAQKVDEADAKSHAQKVLKMAPDFSAGDYLETLQYKNDSDREHHREALLKAGLPS